MLVEGTEKSLMTTRDRRRSRDFVKMPAIFLCLILPSLNLFLSPLPADDRQLRGEAAQFDIYVDGKEIGQEKYSIAITGDSITSRSVTNFRNPRIQRQKVEMETQLSMNGRYLPITYQLRTNVNGQKGTINGTFAPGEANFEYLGAGNPRKRGLMMGERFIVLDTNVFHHFIFLVRSFDLSTDKRQSIDVVIPQELDAGVLKMSEIGMEMVPIGGKSRALRHLRADSGLRQIDLWVGDQQALYKIALPAKGIEVIRK